MKEIWIVRHGDKEITNRANPPLSTKGIEEVKSITLEVDIAYISPLRRALQTFEESNIKAKEVEISELFREYKRSESCFLEGEDKILEEEIDFLKRVQEAIRHISSNKKVVIISHEDFLYAFQKELGIFPVMLKTGEVKKVI